MNSIREILINLSPAIILVAIILLHELNPWSWSNAIKQCQELRLIGIQASARRVWYGWIVVVNDVKFNQKSVKKCLKP